MKANLITKQLCSSTDQNFTGSAKDRQQRVCTIPTTDDMLLGNRKRTMITNCVQICRPLLPPLLLLLLIVAAPNAVQVLDGGSAAVVQWKLETGRTHQIR
jgi:hypothetical protein